MDGRVVKVEFYAGGVKVGEDTDGADGWCWEWSVQTDGLHTVIAVAEDDQGLRSLSEPEEIGAKSGAGRGR